MTPYEVMVEKSRTKKPLKSRELLNFGKEFRLREGGRGPFGGATVFTNHCPLVGAAAMANFCNKLGYSLRISRSLDLLGSYHA